MSETPAPEPTPEPEPQPEPDKRDEREGREGEAPEGSQEVGKGVPDGEYPKEGVFGYESDAPGVQVNVTEEAPEQPES